MRLTAGTAVIAGTVLTDEATPRPLRRVTLALNAAGGPSISRMITTDDQGRFAFTKLGAGNYSALRATKPGYVAAAYGQKRIGGIGVPITLAEGQRVNVTIKMARGGVITGTITDEGGKPAVQVNVQATQVRTVNGERQPTGNMFGSSASTDDRGVYRIYGLTPGDFLVVASARLPVAGEIRPVTADEMRWAQTQMQPAGAAVPAGAGLPAGAGSGGPLPPPKPGQAIANAPIYYPSTVDMVSAVPVTVAAGQEVAGIDMRISLVPTAKVEGTIVDPDGQPAQNVQMNAIAKVDNTIAMAPGLMFGEVFANRPQVTNGKFTIPALRPGQYLITARAAPRAPAGTTGTTGTTGTPGTRGMPMPPAMSLWATAEVTVAGVDQSGLMMRLEPGMTVSGRVVFEGTVLQPPSDLSRVNLRLQTAPSPGGVTISINPSTAPVAEDGTFTFRGITPGRYILSANAPAGTAVPGVTWQVKSAMVGAIDAADAVFEVKPGENVSNAVLTFTDKNAEVSGTLSDAAGKPTSEFSVILFSADRGAWNQRSRRWRQPVRAGTDGKFKFTNLPPGDYYLAALTDFEQSDLTNASFFEQVAATGAIKITVAEGEKKVQDLKLAGG